MQHRQRSASSLPSAVAVTVTVCGVSQFESVKVRPVEESERLLPGVIATATFPPTGSLVSATVYDETDTPSSVTSSTSGVNANPFSSSFSSVSVTPGGAVTPLPPATVTETVTDLSAASTSLSFAVTVTMPVLLVAPAAMVSVFAVLNV